MTTITCLFDVDCALKECKQIQLARNHLEQAELIMGHIDYTIPDYAVEAIADAIKLTAEAYDELNADIARYEQDRDYY